MKTSKISYILIIVLVLIIFSSCQHQRYVPTEGQWFCEELQIQLSYDDGHSSYLLDNGEKIVCSNETDPGTRCIMVYCQEQNHEKYEFCSEIFTDDCISFDQEKMIVVDQTTGKEFIFKRVK